MRRFIDLDQGKILIYLHTCVGEFDSIIVSTSVYLENKKACDRGTFLLFDCWR